MEVRLKVLVGASAGQEIKVVGPKFFIGRAEDCQLRPRSDLVSRHHCVILVEESYVAVRDFGSKNGTLINGERVSGERELSAGDHLKVGPLEFEIVVLAGAAHKKRSKVESLQEAAVRTAESNSKEFDVSEWLSADEAPANHETRISDTRTVALNETDAIDLRPPVVEEEPKAATPPPPPKPATADTRAAASDVLNKFFKRR